jgi:GNAT superfamily N-acetyltransferase
VSLVPVEVFTWLGLRRQQAEEFAQRASEFDDGTGWLAEAAAQLADVHARLSRAVGNTLRIHQPDKAGRCREDGQRWPCRTQRATAEALRPPSQPCTDMDETQLVPRVDPSTRTSAGSDSRQPTAVRTATEPSPSAEVKPLVRYYDRPDPDLERHLAHLAYAAIYGQTDQRPITAGLVQSTLLPTGQAPPTLLATLHTDQGEPIGAVALRWPASPREVGRLWGPVVHPRYQRQGLGRALLDEVGDQLARARATAGFTTDGVPASRERGHGLFGAAGWEHNGTSVLLKAPLREPASPPEGPVRHLENGEDRSAELTRLYAACHPDDDAAAAADVFTRWRADTRFRPDCLILAPGPPGRIRGAALIYPQAFTDPPPWPGLPDEPTEALVAELLVDPHEPDTDQLRHHLLGAGLFAGHRRGAAVARAVVDLRENATLAALGRHGFTRVDELHFYARHQPVQ